MHPIKQRRSAGFTIVEVLVTLVIVGIAVKIGMSSLGGWYLTANLESANEFYMEGFRLARAEAVKHKASSRLTLINNVVTNQYDWQVDLCFSTVTVNCDFDSGAWSTTSAIATGDPEGSAGFKSVLRNSPSMPRSEILDQDVLPLGASQVYFTPLGWVDTTFSSSLTRLTLKPNITGGRTFPTTAIVITLSGMASKCLPLAAAHDSRGCPPLP